MKILVLNWRDINHPRAGGAEVRLHNVYERLVEAGHSVTLVVSKFPGSQTKEDLNGIQVVRIGNDLTHPIKAWWYCRKILTNFDHLVEDFNKLPYLSPLWKGNTQSTIQMHHLWGRSIFQEGIGLTALLVWLSEKLLSVVYTKENFIVVSDSTSKELGAMSIPAKQIQVIHNGNSVKYTGLIPMALARKKQILWLGRLQKYKGILDALEAFAAIHPKNLDWNMIIAGDGPFRLECQKYAEKLNIADCVSFVGFVSQTEKEKLLLESYVLLQTSYKEGWGLTVIEAGQYGLPVIANSAPGLVDSVKEGKNGLLYDFGCVEGLATSIQSLIDNPLTWESLSIGGVQWAQNFSWDKTFLETEALLKKELRYEK